MTTNAGDSKNPPRILVVCACGKKLAAPPKAAGKRVKCPNCGEQVGVPERPTERPSLPTNPQPDQRPKRALIVMWSSVGLLLVVCVVYLLYDRNARQQAAHQAEVDANAGVTTAVDQAKSWLSDDTASDGKEVEEALTASLSNEQITERGSAEFVLEQVRSQRANLAAEGALNRAVTEAQSWLSNGTASDGHKVEEALTTALANELVTQTADAEFVLEQVRTRRPQLAADAIFESAKQELERKNLEEAVSQLRQYLKEQHATQKAEAELLLNESQLAVSDNAAYQTLLAMRPTTFNKFKESGKYDDAKVTHIVLKEIRNETLQRNQERASEKREQVSKRLEEERIAVHEIAESIAKQWTVGLVINLDHTENNILVWKIIGSQEAPFESLLAWHQVRQYITPEEELLLARTNWKLTESASIQLLERQVSLELAVTKFRGFRNSRGQRLRGLIADKRLIYVPFVNRWRFPAAVRDDDDLISEKLKQLVENMNSAETLFNTCLTDALAREIVRYEREFAKHETDERQKVLHEFELTLHEGLSFEECMFIGRLAHALEKASTKEQVESRLRVRAKIRAQVQALVQKDPQVITNFKNQAMIAERTASTELNEARERVQTLIEAAYLTE
jgi:hypothetical protein